MKVQVAFERPLIVSSWGKEHGDRFYPFKNVSFMLQEDIVCPFCGRKLTGLHCCCEEWNAHFARLQEKYCDVEHRSRLQRGILGVRVAYAEPIANLTIDSLTRKKAVELGPDFWDDAARYSCKWVDSEFMVSSGTYENGSIKFYVKNLRTKTVYLCEEKKELKTDRISLAICNDVDLLYGRRRLCPSYKTLVTFDSWQELCKALKGA